ncbi:hypothetical protein LA080_010449 [Diaporthe eres]|nr:hypothetical protein LA080_010449 [Diaporthe eres]
MAQLELGLDEDFDNTGEGQLKVPGFCYYYQFELETLERFRHGANDFQQSPRLTAREVAMLGVMNALTDKPDWHKKIFDDEIVAKWKQEACALPLISDMAWDWCLTELRDKAKRFERIGRVLVLDAGSRLSKSDQRISQSLRQELKDAVKPLLDRPDAERDWHPGSDDKVLNLVHPSLFPLVYGRTRVLVNGGKVPLDLANIEALEGAEVAPRLTATSQPSRPLHGDGTHSGMWSKQFQWLPCEVEFTEDTGTNVHISSYINNLHPAHHAEVYTAIEKVIALAIAPWNEVLVHGYHGRAPPRIRTYGAEFGPGLPEWYEGLNEIARNWESNPEAYEAAKKQVLQYMGKTYTAPDSATGSADEEDLTEESDDESEIDIEEYGLSGAADEFYRRNFRKVFHPEPGVSFSYEQWKAGLSGNVVVKRYRSFGFPDALEDSGRDDHDYYSLRIQDDFRDEGLQVIIKLSSIELTPEKPEYEGGNWHIEGMLNEHIAATALYYYDVDNVTDAKISFRTEAELDSMDMRYEQDDHAPLAEIFGIASRNLRDEPPFQNLGSVTTPQGRLLAFPNTLQHKVEPFELVDKTRPGHRRFLVLWLVDPHYRICSTRNVPPQQESWYDGNETKPESGTDAPDATTKNGESANGRMSLEEAKKLRLELMAERTKKQKHMENASEQYNFCEH